MFKMEQIKL